MRFVLLVSQSVNLNCMVYEKGVWTWVPGDPPPGLTYICNEMLVGQDELEGSLIFDTANNWLEILDF